MALEEWNQVQLAVGRVGFQDQGTGALGESYSLGEPVDADITRTTTPFLTKDSEIIISLLVLQEWQELSDLRHSM